MSIRQFAVTAMLMLAVAGFSETASARFIQPDPIGLQGGMNPYAYVDGSPISRTDPSGEVPVPLITGGVGMVTSMAGTFVSQMAMGGWKCVDRNAILLSGATGFVNGALLPFMGGGIVGAATLGAATNGIQSMAANAIQSGSPTAQGGSGYPMLQALASGAVGGMVGGAFKPPFVPTIPALLQPSPLASQTAASNLLRNTMGGGISGAPTLGEPCGCQ